MRRVATNFLWSLLFLACAFPAQAASGRQKTTILSVRHSDAKVDTLEPSGVAAETADLADPLEFDIDPGETLVIQIKDPNPLLFTYTLTAIPPTDTDNLKAAQALLAGLKDVASALGKLAPSTTDSARSFPAPPPSPPEKEENLEAMRKSVEKKDFSSPDITAKDVKNLLTVFKYDLDDLTSKTQEIPDQIAKSARSFSAADQVKADVLTWNGKDLLGHLEDDLKKINQAGLRSDSLPTSSTLIARVLQAQVQITQVRSLMDKLKSFIEAAEGIHVSLSLAPAVSFDALHDSGATLDIAARKGSEEEAGKSPLRKGKFKFVVHPFSPVGFSYGPAAVYSFIETEDFGTKTENGKITIVRKDSGNQINGLAVGVMLSITPRQWSNPAFRRSVQLGFSPVKDKFGIFLGGSVRFFDLLSLGGGIAYQQAERLASGLSLNQEIASEDKLKTNIVFKPGFYLTMTLELGGKK